jgi:polysaccharide biosynthesis/export protein
LDILKFAGLFLVTAIFFCSCSAYKQNIMFRLPKGQNLQQEMQKAEANYIIQKNDRLQIDIYTNKGERIIDPSLAALQSSAAGSQDAPLYTYLVDQNGTLKLPLIEEIKIDGYSLREAEVVLQKEYAKYYQEPFVVLNYSNKRVVVLGALGGQVIPLVNENMKLTEVLALAKGIGNDAKANNIRILRGETIYVADLSTIEGYQKNNLLMQPNDIIYVEPVRRPFIEALRDYGPILSISTSIATLIVLLVGTNSTN